MLSLLTSYVFFMIFNIYSSWFPRRMHSDDTGFSQQQKKRCGRIGFVRKISFETIIDRTSNLPTRPCIRR